MAANIAALLAQKNSVILLELRPTYGTLAFQLQAAAPANLASLLDLAPERIDGQALSAPLFLAADGLRILFGPQNV